MQYCSKSARSSGFSTRAAVSLAATVRMSAAACGGMEPAAACSREAIASAFASSSCPLRSGAFFPRPLVTAPPPTPRSAGTRRLCGRASRGAAAGRSARPPSAWWRPWRAPSRARRTPPRPRARRPSGPRRARRTGRVCRSARSARLRALYAALRHAGEQ